MKKVDVSDNDIIKFLENKGYMIEGLIGDVYYDSRVNNMERQSSGAIMTGSTYEVQYGQRA